MKLERYRTHGGKRIIDIRVSSALQLFDARDPAPFRARDLDDDFVEYVTAAAEEIPGGGIEIAIHIDERPAVALDAQSIAESIRAFFEYQIDLRRLQISKLFRTARLFLMIGFGCLILCLLAGELLEKMPSPSTFHRVLREGIIIFGWVSLWKPFELLLFDWYPAYDRMKLLRRLAKCNIQISFKG